MPTARSGHEIARPKATVTELRARIRALERGWERGCSSHAFEGAPPGIAAPGIAAPGVLPPGIMPPGIMPPEIMPPEIMPPEIMPLGVPAIDAHLPDGGLRLAGLHEIVGARDEWDDAVAAGFCLALLGRLAGSGAILWAARRADLYGPGVASPGRLIPSRLILVHARRDAEVLWALEEGLRAPTGTLSAVVGEAGVPDDTALRRLQLAAETAGRPCFLLRRRLFAAAPGSTHMSASAVALTRWRVAALPSVGAFGEMGRTDLPGRPRWRLDLLRCRGAAPGTFMVEWDDAAGDFALAAPVRDRPVAQEAAPGCGHRRVG